MSSELVQPEIRSRTLRTQDPNAVQLTELFPSHDPTVGSREVGVKGFPISFQVRWSRLGWNRPGCGHTTGGRDLRPSDPSPHSFLNAGYLRTGDVLVSSLNVTSSHLPLSSRVVLSHTFYSCELCDGRRCGAGGQRADHGEAFTSGCNEARHTFTRRSSRGALRGEDPGRLGLPGREHGWVLPVALPPSTHPQGLEAPPTAVGPQAPPATPT